MESYYYANLGEDDIQKNYKLVICGCFIPLLLLIPYLKDSESGYTKFIGNRGIGIIITTLTTAIFIILLYDFVQPFGNILCVLLGAALIILYAINLNQVVKESYKYIPVFDDIGLRLDMLRGKS